MFNRKYLSQELLCELRTSLRRVFLRIHPDKFWEFPTEASVNKFAFQQLNHLVEELETIPSRAGVTSQFTCYLREASDISTVQGAQVELFHSTLYRLTIRTTEDCRVPPNALLLLRVFEVFNLKIPQVFAELVKELESKSANARVWKTLDDFVENHGSLVGAHILQSTFFSNMESRRDLPNASSKIFDLCRQLESKMRIFVRVQRPTEELFYDELLRLKTLLTTDEYIFRKVKGCRIFLTVSDCCFVNSETGVVILGTAALNKEWETTLWSSENVSCCEEFSQLDSNIRKQERIVERILKLRKITCTREILWNRFFLAKYLSFLSQLADCSISQEDSVVPFAKLFETVGFFKLEITLTKDPETNHNTSNVLENKICLMLSDNCFYKGILNGEQQSQQLSVRCG
ncbi:uncharacterized protein Gasu_51050 [Galdieria sulphuraria]|uniref:DUF4460 domain-containing protein n=1 Tax=Galdieria sulphuraria TaxID=130081 RepID=M2XVG2_GALSU|nr:uncharacterized protein Gasu_51050 [Galdieria sulphuraria]EME27379.1 hypothetical protein Gasu_51050 [Galdieria sulphuraria]|eukprot:XP_005703899.1 hypothetical protein Gasu_51050 [Galdieria sulphuraria]